MSNNLNDKKAEIFKALSNPVRLDVIEQLLEGEKCVCKIQDNLKKYKQTHISKSLQKLKSVGLIKDRREGMNIYYSLRIGCIGELLACLNKMLKNEIDVC